jgi:hypothetical protein
MKKYLKTVMYVLIALSISIMFSCKQSKTETFEITWDIYTLKVSAFQELPNTENETALRQVQITLDYVADSENQQSDGGLPMNTLEKSYNDFILIDSNGNTFTPLGNLTYKLASMQFNMSTGAFIELISEFNLTYDIPENISVRDLSLKVNEQIINLAELRKSVTDKN